MNIRTSGTSFLVTLAMWSGLEMEQAVTASGQSFEARPPAAADREAVWYPGYVQIRGADGDRNTRSLWLTGQAAAGKSMAMAGTIALPDDAQIQSVAVGRNAYRLSLDVSIKVERGHTYDFSKFVAFSREGWGDDAAADLQLARQARDQGFEHQLTERRPIPAGAWVPAPRHRDIRITSSLDLQMDPQLRQGNYDFAVRPASLARVGGFSMGLAPHVIAAAVIGNEAEATRWLDANYSGGTLKPPFLVRTETAGNNTGI